MLSLGAGTYYVEVVPNYNTTRQQYALCVTEAAQTLTMHRLCNPNAASGTRNYTTSLAENDLLARAGWVPEDIGWYAVSAQ